MPFNDRKSDVLKVFIKYIHTFIWLSEWGGGSTFVTGLASISPPSNSGNNTETNNYYF